MTTTDAKKLAAAACHRAGNCAQACHGGLRVRKISDHAADAFATAVRAAALGTWVYQNVLETITISISFLFYLFSCICTF